MAPVLIRRRRDGGTVRGAAVFIAALALALEPATAADRTARKPAEIVATVASAGGTVEIQRGREWLPALIGNPVFDGETVRSGADSTATLVFADDAVLRLAPATTLRVDEYAARTRRALLTLDGGAVEAIVSGFGSAGGRFEIATPSAIARVQGTQFVVRHDAASRATEVGGLEGVVAVQGRTGLIGPAVTVGANQMSRVEAGKFPSPIKNMDAAQRGAMLAGLEAFGTGERDGLDVDNALLEGSTVAASDRPQASAAAAGSYVKPGIPGEPLIDRLSPDVRANTQSLPVYEAVPPNEVPPQP